MDKSNRKVQQSASYWGKPVCGLEALPSSIAGPMSTNMSGQLHVLGYTPEGQVLAGGVTCGLLVVQGHAIECRINAEDPFKNFRPGPGRVVGYLAPGGPYVRMDSHLYPDYLVSPHPCCLLACHVTHTLTHTQ